MQQKLQSICSIRAGLTLRKGSYSPSAESQTHLLKIRDIGSTYAELDFRNPIEITADTNKFIANSGDILFSSRGISNKASVMPEHTGTFLAPSQIYILTPNDSEALLPEFLALYLSSFSAEKYFKEKRKGTNVQIITKKSLCELLIAIPPVEQQQQLIRLQELTDKEEQIQNQIHTLRVKQYEHAILQTQQITN